MQFLYNITLYKEIRISLFKINYKHKLRILILLKKVKKKSNKIAKERVQTLMDKNSSLSA